MIVGKDDREKTKFSGRLAMDCSRSGCSHKLGSYGKSNSRNHQDLEEAKARPDGSEEDSEGWRS